MNAPGHAAVAETEAPAPSIGWTIACLALATLLPALGTSIANVALPTLAEAFGASFPEVQWIVLAYLLATTVSIVGVGRLGDLLGRRQLLMAGLLLFTAASLASAFAPTLWLLVAARAAQGLGAAAMMALPMALAGEIFPKARTGSAMGLLGAMSAIGTALGPSLGGLLLAGFGWRSIFLLIAPLGAVTLILVRRVLPVDRRGPAADLPAFDVKGSVLLALTLAAYALAMTGGRGVPGPLVIALLSAALIGAGLFLRVEARAASPLVRLAMFRKPSLSAGFAMSALVMTVMMATLVIGPFHLSIALGLDAARAGLVMSVGPVVAALTGGPAGRLVDRFGAQGTIMVGLAGMAVGCVALSLVPSSLGVPGYVAPLVAVTAGYAMFQAANNTAVMSGTAANERGVVSGLVNLARSLGMITGASVMGSVFALASGAVDVAVASADAVAAGTRITFAVATGLAGLALVIAVVSRSRPRLTPACARAR
jgi:MFS family permease